MRTALGQVRAGLTRGAIFPSAREGKTPARGRWTTDWTWSRSGRLLLCADGVRAVTRVTVSYGGTFSGAKSCSAGRGRPGPPPSASLLRGQMPALSAFPGEATVSLPLPSRISESELVGFPPPETPTLEGRPVHRKLLLSVLWIIMHPPIPSYRQVLVPVQTGGQRDHGPRNPVLLPVSVNFDCVSRNDGSP